MTKFALRLLRATVWVEKLKSKFALVRGKGTKFEKMMQGYIV